MNRVDGTFFCIMIFVLILLLIKYNSNGTYISHITIKLFGFLKIDIKQKKMDEFHGHEYDQEIHPNNDTNE